MQLRTLGQHGGQFALFVKCNAGGFGAVRRKFPEDGAIGCTVTGGKYFLIESDATVTGYGIIP